MTTFFPFDPYKLPRTCSYIDGIYREWTSVALDGEDDDDDDEDEETVESERGDVLEQDLHMHGPQSFVEDLPVGLGESFGGMSISPAGVRIPVSSS